MPKAHGFPPDERVRHKAEFDRVFREGRRARGPFLAVCCAGTGLPHSRLGIALSRGWKGAVPRNRAKRLIREAFRLHKHEWPKGVDLVVVPVTNWRAPSVAAIAGELARLLASVARDSP